MYLVFSPLRLNPIFLLRGRLYTQNNLQEYSHLLASFGLRKILNTRHLFCLRNPHYSDFLDLLSLKTFALEQLQVLVCLLVYINFSHVFSTRVSYITPYTLLIAILLLRIQFTPNFVDKILFIFYNIRCEDRKSVV